MEQLLNILWLLAMAALIYATGARRYRRPHAPHSWCAVVVVFACIALLLFPVISASDDLHAACDLSDDAAWRHDKRSLGNQFLPVLLLISITPLLLCRVRLQHAHDPAPAARPGFFRLDSGRAPPFSF